MRRGLLRTTLVGLVLAAISGNPVAALADGIHPAFQVDPPTYEVEDLGTLPGDSSSVAMGINDAGDVVGWSLGPTGTRAFLYTDETGMIELPGPAGRPRTYARTISDTGFVAGTAMTSTPTDIGHAVRWEDGVPLDLGTLGTGSFSEARGINAAGVTVGYSYTDGGTFPIHAFKFDELSGLVDLTPASDGQAQAINDVGQITGWRNTRAFRISGNTFTDLGVPAGFLHSWGYAINDSGQVAGHVTSATGNVERIFRYSDGVGMVILGGTGSFNRASGINNAGDVVGQRLSAGFVFTDADGMRSLNSLIDPSLGWFIFGGGDINNAGQIAAWASGPPGHRALRLTPVGDEIDPPAAPSGLIGTVLSPTSVRLNWTDNSNSETGFNVHRALGPHGQFVQVAQVGQNTTTYTDTTVLARRLYRYRVQAFNSAGASAWSNTIRVRPG